MKAVSLVCLLVAAGIAGLLEHDFWEAVAWLIAATWCGVSMLEQRS